MGDNIISDVPFPGTTIAISIMPDLVDMHEYTCSWINQATQEDKLTIASRQTTQIILPTMNSTTCTDSLVHASAESLYLNKEGSATMAHKL